MNYFALQDHLIKNDELQLEYIYSSSCHREIFFSLLIFKILPPFDDTVHLDKFCFATSWINLLMKQELWQPLRLPAAATGRAIFYYMQAIS